MNTFCLQGKNSQYYSSVILIITDLFLRLMDKSDDFSTGQKFSVLIIFDIIILKAKNVIPVRGINYNQKEMEEDKTLLSNFSL